MDRGFEGWSSRQCPRGCAVLMACVVVALMVGVATLSAASGASFTDAQSYATENNPVSVAIGDLNGDGKPDLATANEAAGNVSVLLNAGGGSFEARLDYATGYDPLSVAIGDLNGDRK